jgi:hypothetical protein
MSYASFRGKAALFLRQSSGFQSSGLSSIVFSMEFHESGRPAREGVPQFGPVNTRAPPQYGRSATGHEGTWGSGFLLTSALDWTEWLDSRPSRFIPVKNMLKLSP